MSAALSASGFVSPPLWIVIRLLLPVGNSAHAGVCCLLISRPDVGPANQRGASALAPPGCAQCSGCWALGRAVSIYWSVDHNIILRRCKTKKRRLTGALWALGKGMQFVIGGGAAPGIGQCNVLVRLFPGSRSPPAGLMRTLAQWTNSPGNKHRAASEGSYPGLITILS